MIFYAPVRWWGRRRSATLIPSGWCLTPDTRGRCCSATSKLLCIRHFNQNQSYGFHNSENA